MSNENMYIWLQDYEEKIEIQPWEELNQVIRKWAALTGHEKDQNNYQKMKEMYQ